MTSIVSIYCWWLNISAGEQFLRIWNFCSENLSSIFIFSNKTNTNNLEDYKKYKILFAPIMALNNNFLSNLASWYIFHVLWLRIINQKLLHCISKTNLLQSVIKEIKVWSYYEPIKISRVRREKEPNNQKYKTQMVPMDYQRQKP